VMVDLKARLSSARAKLLRRSSGTPSASSGGGDDPLGQAKQPRPSSQQNQRNSEGKEELQQQERGIDEYSNEGTSVPVAGVSHIGTGTEKLNQLGRPVSHASIINTTDLAHPIGSPTDQHQQPQSPDTLFTDIAPLEFSSRDFAQVAVDRWQIHGHEDKAAPLLSAVQLPQHPQPQSSRPNKEFFRRQSLVPPSQTRLIRTLLESELPPPSQSSNQDIVGHHPLELSTSMVNRKIWVKRLAGSATLVSIHEDDLVDDVREMILKKYANSLGRSFDAPDITLRIIPRDHPQRHYREVEKERVLAPDESIARALDSYFPGGQTVEDALVIEVPLRRTPKPSPRSGYHMREYSEDSRLGEGGDYFPPMPAAAPSPHLPTGSVSNPSHGGGSQHPSVHSMSVLTTGQVPSLPSPGRGARHHRPRVGRTHTSSPTIMTSTPGSPNNGTIIQTRSSRSSVNSNTSDHKQAPPSAPPLPSTSTPETPHKVASSTPPRCASPRPTPSKKGKNKVDHPQLPAGLLDGTVPPINVLIVEDNIINLKLLEAFMKRLKVRWQTAMNGKEAVSKWRTGGFHLVLMDIQLPVMNGLEATKEIRRLERLNSIGVFSSPASTSAPEAVSESGPIGDDKLTNTYLFKSPVIIVALTASSLQSDRHEALAAGCNDFLTKVRPPYPLLPSPHIGSLVLYLS
jgi:osomolarity two-component system response regulator SSK1